jgi:hypothetical protein
MRQKTWASTDISMPPATDASGGPAQADARDSSLDALLQAATRAAGGEGGGGPCQTGTPPWWTRS